MKHLAPLASLSIISLAFPLPTSEVNPIITPTSTNFTYFDTPALLSSGDDEDDNCASTPNSGQGTLTAGKCYPTCSFALAVQQIPSHGCSVTVFHRSATCRSSAGKTVFTIPPGEGRSCIHLRDTICGPFGDLASSVMWRRS
jgi:hypothetical protein